MNYAGIKYCDIANGLGCRTVLFVSGCRNACKGCFQPQTWDFTYGECFDEQVQQKVLDSLKPEYIEGMTLLGGEPFEEENQEALLPFMKKVKSLYPDKNVWAFTGYISGKCPDILIRIQTFYFFHKRKKSLLIFFLKRLSSQQGHSLYILRFQ